MRMNTIIGIDVSKLQLACAWLREDGRRKTKTLPNTAAGHAQLLTWAAQQTGQPVSASRFVMEPTGVYHEPLAYALHEAGAEVWIVNPAQLRYFAQGLGVRGKDDLKDSIVLARFGAQDGRQRPWQPEPKPVRELKALLHRLESLGADRQRERNRLEKAQISRANAEVETSIQLMLERIDAEIARLHDEIDSHIDHHPGLKQDLDYLRSIPGVGPVLGRYMLATYHSRDFDNAGQMVAFLGMVPEGRESGTSVRVPAHLSKAGPARIRKQLYMPAVVSIKYNPQAKALYERLVAHGKAKKSALGAVMRKLVVWSFAVLKHQQPYRPAMS